jgi:hypothetical protein
LCIMPYTIYTHAELLINLILYFDLKVPGGPQNWPWPAWNFGAIHSVIDIHSSSRMPALYVTNSFIHTLLQLLISSQDAGKFVYCLQIPILMCACIWSSPPQEVLGFPALFVLSFFRHNQLLEVTIHLLPRASIVLVNLTSIMMLNNQMELCMHSVF